MGKNTENIFKESYFLGILDEEINKDKKHFILIIYDISNNKRRTRMVKVLESYGVRVQKSAFEALLRPNKYKKLLKSIKDIPDLCDSVRIYKIQGRGTVEVFGTPFSLEEEETIII